MTVILMLQVNILGLFIIGYIEVEHLLVRKLTLAQRDNNERTEKKALTSVIMCIVQLAFLDVYFALI